MIRRLATAIAVLALAAAVGCGETEEEPQRPRGGNPPDPRAVLEKLDAEQVAARASELRGLEFEEDAPEVRIISPRETVDYLRRQTERTYPQERREADEAFLKLSGLLPPDGDLDALLESFGGGLLLGFYDPERPDILRMVTSQRASDAKSAESTLAHELVHGLQDQAFGLEEKFDIEDPDRKSAVQGLIEGDTTVFEAMYAQRFLGGLSVSPPPQTNIPPGILLSLLFPYAEGSEFVGELVKRGDGTFREVDRAFRERLPQSTEQIIHPEKYFAGEEPRAVDLNADEALGGGWESIKEDTFGELDAVVILSTKALNSPQATQAGEGWDGGTAEVFERGDDRALAIGTTWESDAEATEFAKAYEMSLGRDRGARPAGEAFMLPGGLAADVVADGRDVRIAVTPTPELATEVVKQR